ncbi:MAG TPA: substrate-binding domain-containing protein [Casimicrobiaceae bacterium]|nr:substrate-binding domain-containing protein [Casimicrobiaceae bacterium]
MDLDVLSAGASKGLVESLQAQFSAETGVGIHGTFRPVGAIREKALAGEPCDVIILTAEMIDELARSGIVLPGTIAPLGRVRTAIAVRDGDSLPDISGRQALHRLVLASAAIYLPDAERATAGIHFVKVLHALGVYETVEPRLRSYPNGATAMRELAQSLESSAIGCTQVTEIKYTHGVRLVGPLPAEFELATTYAVGVYFKAHQPELARRFAELLSGESARELRLNGGFED